MMKKKNNNKKKYVIVSQKLYPTQITRAGLKYKLDKIISIYKDLKGIS